MKPVCICTVSVAVTSLETDRCGKVGMSVKKITLFLCLLDK